VSRWKADAAIAGLGITEMGKIYGRSAADFAAEAVALALDDAGLAKSDIDGLLINGNGNEHMTPYLQMALGFQDLSMLNVMSAAGSTVGAMVQYAALALEAGVVSNVVLLYADAPLQQSVGAAAAYAKRGQWHGMNGLRAAYGEFGGNPPYALAARRHMHLYGTTSEQLGAIAVSQRKWAQMNPRAQMQKPMTLEDHQSSRMVVDPFHLFDCCLVSNGGLAVIVTGSERARNLRKAPVYIWGMGQGHLGGDPADTLTSGAVLAREPAFRMAGVRVTDLDLAELYDCYTFTVIVSLEDYGFCAKGEGGPFVAEQVTGPGGRLAVNTGGGQLSSFYMWGMTPVSEAVIQVRGEGGERQVPRHDLALVSGNGGVFSTHSTLVLSRHVS
jgi:acetyl-CoA acetyltransferase